MSLHIDTDISLPKLLEVLEAPLDGFEVERKGLRLEKTKKPFSFFPEGSLSGFVGKGKAGIADVLIDEEKLFSMIKETLEFLQPTELFRKERFLGRG